MHASDTRGACWGCLADSRCLAAGALHERAAARRLPRVRLAAQGATTARAEMMEPAASCAAHISGLGKRQWAGQPPMEGHLPARARAARDPSETSETAPLPPQDCRNPCASTCPPSTPRTSPHALLGVPQAPWRLQLPRPSRSPSLPGCDKSRKSHQQPAARAAQHRQGAPGESVPAAPPPLAPPPPVGDRQARRTAVCELRRPGRPAWTGPTSASSPLAAALCCHGTRSSPPATTGRCASR